MEEQKIYVCPNCGATTTNAEYCEHCGSLLVRFVAQGIDISNTPYTDDSIVFPGLIEELEKNLRYQEEGKEEVYTMIKWINKSGEEDELQIDPEDTTSDSKDFDVQQIVIYLCFDRPISPKSPYYQYHKNKDAQLTKFTQLKSFPLFTSDMGEDDANVDVDNRWLYRGYYLNCGKDVKGAARLISEIMVKVKGVSPADSYGAFTRYEDDNFQDAFIEWMKAHGFDYSEYVDDDNNMFESVDLPNDTNLNANNQNDVEMEVDFEAFSSSFKDLVKQALSNGADINNKAESNDAAACFQMGMIHLLGINTPIDFKKASLYLGNQSLKDNADTIHLLGFVAECEGNYSQAFRCYSKIETSKNGSYLDRVVKGRNCIQDYLRKHGLPLTMNKGISSILNDYSKGKDLKTNAIIKMAVICEDEQMCLEAAKNLFDAKDYISAIQWLKKGNIPADNAMYMAINDMFEKSKANLINSKVIQIVDLDSNSLLSNEDPALLKIKKSCDKASKNCLNEWKETVKYCVDTIIKNYKEEKKQEFLAACEEKKAKNKKLNIIAAIAVVVFFGVLFAMLDSSSVSKHDDAVNKVKFVAHKELNGSIDNYPITMELHIEGSNVNGSLYYKKYGPENRLILSGFSKKNEIELNESEKSGKPTGRFIGTYSNGVFQGEYTTSKGKSMPFKVSE